MSSLSQKLIQIGFSKNQATVYEALISLGQCKASGIIKRTGLHRNIVYEALDHLVQQKLAFKTTKGGVALFQLSDADSIITSAEKQLRTAQEISEEINTLRQKSSHEIKMYEGMSGLDTYISHIYRNLSDESLSPTEKEFLVLGTDPKSNKDLFDSFWQKKNKERAKLGIPSRILFEESSKQYAEEANQIDQLEAKLLPPSISDPTIAYIWKDTVAFVLYELEPFIVSIENKRLADSFRDYFNNLWEQDTKIYKGVDAIQQMMEESLEYSDNWFIGGNGGIEKVMPEYWEDYNARRIEKRVWWHDLVDQDMYLSGIQKMPPGYKDEEHFYEFKWLPQDVSSPTVIFLYGDTAAHITWEAEPEPIAFTIKNKQLVDSYKKYFSYLWNQDVVVTRGLENTLQLFKKKSESLQSGDTYAVMWGSYGSDEHLKKNNMLEWFVEYNTDRIARNIQLEILMFEKDREAIVYEMDTAGDKTRDYTTIRFEKGESFEKTVPMQINIYPDSIIMFNWGDTPEETLAIEIQSMGIRNSMRQYFEAIWHNASEE